MKVKTEVLYQDSPFIPVMITGKMSTFSSPCLLVLLPTSLHISTEITNQSLIPILLYEDMTNFSRSSLPFGLLPSLCSSSY